MTGCKAACPHCDVDIWWRSAEELGRHIRMCALIEGGRLVDDVNSSIPEVEELPAGWDWVPPPGV
jgi:hypothetical protein